jgi:hypothetical protein
MIRWLIVLIHLVVGGLKSRRNLLLENLALQAGQELFVADQQQAKGRLATQNVASLALYTSRVTRNAWQPPKGREGGAVLGLVCPGRRNWAQRRRGWWDCKCAGLAKVASSCKFEAATATLPAA